MSKRILIIANSYPLTGDSRKIAPKFLEDFCVALIGLGNEVRVVCPGRMLIDRHERQGVGIVPFNWAGRHLNAVSEIEIKSPKGWIQMLSLLSAGSIAAVQEARNFRPDYVLSAFALPSGLWAWLVKQLLGIPYGVWCLGSDIHTFAKKFGFKQLTSMVLKRANSVYSDGFELGKLAESMFSVKCDFLATTTVLDGAAKANPPPKDPTKRQFLYIGRLELVKGPDVLLEGWALFCRKHGRERIHLTIAGEGSLSDRLREIIRHYELATCTGLVGAVPHESIADLIAMSDVVIIPSRNESIPVVLSEAVQSRRHLIVSDVGDMKQIVERYELGSVFRTESPEALSLSLEKSLDFPPVLSNEKSVKFFDVFDVRKSAVKFLNDAESWPPL